MSKIPKDVSLGILSIGTRILMKDVMDQYLRSLGDVKTYYASKLSVAVSSYQEKRPNIIFCEQTFQEGSALDFIQAIGGLSPNEDQYFVMATEAASDSLVTLAMEKNVDEIIVKPFSTENIHQVVERYLEKKKMAGLEWSKTLSSAKQAFREKRFQEAEELFVKAAKEQGDNPTVAMDCAEFFIYKKDLAKAHAYLDRILSATPENARALHLMGLVYKKSGKLAEAADRFLLASKVSPLNSHRNLEMAETYLQLAEEQVVQALKGDEENSNLILMRARYQLLRKDYTSVVVYLDAKKAFLSDAGKKEADFLTALSKKLGGIK